MDFKDRLKTIRVEKGVTITQLAAQLNKGESAVRMWEIGRSNPDLDTLISLAQYFNCTTDYLLGLSDYKNTDERKLLAEKRNEVTLYLDKLTHTEKKDLLDIFQALINSYTGLNDDKLKKAFIECFNEISGHAADSSDNIFKFPEIDDQMSDTLLIYMLTSARTSMEAISLFYKSLEEYIEKEWVKYKNEK